MPSYSQAFEDLIELNTKLGKIHTHAVMQYHLSTRHVCVKTMWLSWWYPGGKDWALLGDRSTTTDARKYEQFSNYANNNCNNRLFGDVRLPSCKRRGWSSLCVDWETMRWMYWSLYPKIFHGRVARDSSNYIFNFNAIPILWINKFRMFKIGLNF